VSEVHLYWQAIANKFGDNRTWDMLNPQEQQLILQSINMLMFVLGNGK